MLSECAARDCKLSGPGAEVNPLRWGTTIIQTAIFDFLIHFAKMAAPVNERISVPIDDPNADTEW